jgi:hypothetical protein
MRPPGRIATADIGTFMQGLNDYSLMLWQQVRGLARRGDDAIDWRAQARLDCVRAALRSADTLTVQELQREFGEIEIGTVLTSLLDVLKDASLIVLASTGIGGAAGAAVGALAGGVGAIPGAAAGAALGAKVGGWILAVLGLKALADFFIEGLPAILGHYRRGLSRAWAAPDHDRAGDDLRGGQRRQSEVRGAAVDISKGHVAMVLLLLSALVAYLTRGRGNIGQLAAQARRGRLGTRFADWIVKHEAALRNHPRLQGRRNRVAGENDQQNTVADQSKPQRQTSQNANSNASASSALRGAKKAVIDRRKLTDYALNTDHPVGGNKARVFESALGFNRGNADDLSTQIRQGVTSNTAIPGKIDQFGSRYTVDIPVVGPKGSGIVRTGWIYKPGSTVPELTTLFVK